MTTAVDRVDHRLGNPAMAGLADPEIPPVPADHRPETLAMADPADRVPASTPPNSSNA